MSRFRSAPVLAVISVVLLFAALALKESGLAFKRPPGPIPAGLHSAASERFLALSNDELDGVLESAEFKQFDPPAKEHALAEAARRDRLHFASPGEAIAKLRRWYPERALRGPLDVLEQRLIDHDWSAEALAFLVVSQCWPAAVIAQPERDPLRSRGKVDSAWPTDLGACADGILERRAKPSLDEAARRQLADRALAVLRQKLAATLRTTSCRAQGGDDCALLLLELASVAPNGAALRDAIDRVEQQLAASPDLDHPYRRFALARAKVALALGAMESFTAEAPLHLKLLDAAEAPLPRAVLWLRAKTGWTPAPAALPEDTARKFLVDALDAQIAMHVRAEAEHATCCLLEANTHLRPLDPIEDTASADVRQRAVAYLNDEVKRRAAQASCDEGLGRRLNGKSAGGADGRYSLGSQLAFVYAFERLRRSDADACARLVLPHKSPDRPWLVDAEGIIDGLLADDKHPRAHAATGGLLDALCAAAPDSRLCETVAPSVELSEDMLVDTARFVSQTVAADKSALAKHQPAPLADQVLARVDAALCRTEALTVWTHPQRKVVVVEPNCAPTAESDRSRQPLLVARDNSAVWVKVTPDFVHEARDRLLAVTDLDDDGRPELWFKGPLAECEVEEEKPAGAPPCDAEGVAAKEVFGDSWVTFADDRLRAPKIAP